MDISYAAGLVACLTFGAGMLHALVTDLKHRRIRNWLIVALLAAYLPLALTVGLSPGQMAAALVAGLLVFAAGFGCFAAGWLGGGDVKLAAVSALWLGAHQTLVYLLLASVLGAVVGASLMAATALRRRRAGAAGVLPPENPGEMPYGPALAVAGLALLHNSPWSAVL